jgi:hypothetical protein
VRCHQCGKDHGELPLDVGYRRPVPYFLVPEAERATRCFDNDDLCEIDGKIFLVRGVLLVPIRGSEQSFGWGLWASVSKRSFDRIVARFDEDAFDEPPMAGLLAVEPMGYEGLLDQPVTVQLRSSRERPAFMMAPQSKHLLAREEREGITMERAHEIVRVALPWLFN